MTGVLSKQSPQTGFLVHAAYYSENDGSRERGKPSGGGTCREGFQCTILFVSGIAICCVAIANLARNCQPEAASFQDGAFTSSR
jgi:hypothetical protein